MTHPIMLLGILSCTALVACNESSSCREVSRTLVTEPSAPLHVGGTLADLRVTVGGSRSGPLQWLESEQYVRGFPPPAQTEITVTIVEPEAAWDLDFEEHDLQRNERLYCPDYVETELEIELRTADGMLEANVVTLVALDRTSAATIWVDVTDEDLGMLRWDPIEEDASLDLVLSYGTLTGPEGSLRYSYEESDDSGNGVGFMTDLATWTLSP